MNWLALAVPVLLLVLVLAAAVRRRLELRAHDANLAERSAARARGSHQARLQHPSIDLTKCIGCGACVRACPEDGVLALAFGQAVVVHGARCVGHGLCAAACPTAAIALTLGDLSDRRDLPAIGDDLQAVGVPGLFLAGEITGFALVRTAVQHGALVARQVARRVAERPAAAAGEAPLDLLVIGLGPAGIACLLAATEQGLRCLGVDQASELGGTVAAYPRRKLVMTQPMDLPLHGRLNRLEYTKEQLVELWQSLAEQHDLPVRTGVVVQKVERTAGHFAVTTNRGVVRAAHVCLAVGRRGTPQKLGVPGEDLPKVAYSLLDAESYHGRSVLVVGGGDSAIEAALALAEQGDNQVTISYRRAAFARLKARNEQRIVDAVAAGTVTVRFETVVEEITAEGVRLRRTGEPVPAGGGGTAIATAVEDLPADEVFVFAGGTPPFPLLEAAGVSFDPALRPAPAIAADRGTGLLVALAGTLVGMLALLAHRVLRADYYDLPAAARAGSAWHEALRPQGQLGLLAGVAAVGLFAANLCYLWRRSPRFGRRLPGSLKLWMNSHIATGIAACLCAMLHSGFQLRDGAGGHALLAMVVVVAAGVVGRWFYSFVPRAQNGRQQSLEELQGKVAAIAGEWDRTGAGFGHQVRMLVERLAESAQLGRGFFARLRGLVRSEVELRREIARLRVQARREGIPPPEIQHVLSLAWRSHRLALQLSHYEEVRGLLSTWRWLHRWLALLLLLLLVVHVVAALRYGGVDFRVLPGFGGAG
ncbi:MAG: NAD(P)-binding domain-containing protein [Planctomycetes bacterium]|nr:NAD(P)-binding domain-containing protein [Planctomycetota bacterium]